MGGAISSKYIRGCGLNHLLSTTAVCVLLTGLIFPCVMDSQAQAQHIINADNILGYLHEMGGTKWFKPNTDGGKQQAYILSDMSSDFSWDDYGKLGIHDNNVMLIIEAGELGKTVTVDEFVLDDGSVNLIGGRRPALNAGNFTQNDGMLNISSRQGMPALSLGQDFSHSGGKSKITTRGVDSVGLDMQGGDIRINGADSSLQFSARKGAIAVDASHVMSHYVQEQGHVTIEALDRGSVGLLSSHVTVHDGFLSVKAGNEARGVDIGSGVFDLRGGTLRLEQVRTSSTGYAVYGNGDSSAYFRSGSLVETVVDLSAHENAIGNIGFGGQVTGMMQFGHVNIEQNVDLQFDFVSVASLDLTAPQQFVFLESQNAPIEGDFVSLSAKGSTLLYDYELVKTGDGAAYAMELRPKGWVEPPPPVARPVKPLPDEVEDTQEEVVTVPPPVVEDDTSSPRPEDDTPPLKVEESLPSEEPEDLPPSAEPVDLDWDHPTELEPEETPSAVPPLQEEEVTPPKQDNLPPSADPVPWPGDRVDPEPEDPFSPQPDPELESEPEPESEEVRPEEDLPKSPEPSDDDTQEEDFEDVPTKTGDVEDDADSPTDVEDASDGSDDAAIEPPPAILTPSLTHYLNGGSAGYNALSALERVAREAPGSAADNVYDMLNAGTVQQLQQHADTLHSYQTTRLPQLIASGHMRFAGASKEVMQRQLSISPLPQLREGDTFAQAAEREVSERTSHFWQAWVRSVNGVERFKTSGSGLAALENSYMGGFAGATRRFEDFAFNVSFAYLNHGVDGEGDGYQVDGDSFMIMATLGSDSFQLFNQLPLHVDAGVAYGYSRFEQSRRDIMGESSHASLAAKSFHANGGMTHIWQLGDSFALKPRLGVEYAYVSLATYRETGGVLPLGVKMNAYHSLRPQIGSSAEWKKTGQLGKISGLTLGARAAYAYEVMDRRISLSSHYLEVPTIHFSTMGEEIGRGSANVGMYAGYMPGGGLVSLSGGYDATLADSYDGHQFYVQANRKF